jgi:hypothetical protein
MERGLPGRKVRLMGDDHDAGQEAQVID